jgi:hypothetical protein
MIVFSLSIVNVYRVSDARQCISLFAEFAVFGVGCLVKLFVYFAEQAFGSDCSADPAVCLYQIFV